ncbi:hypothetical protein HZ326_23306 [Fusarium oxysporum f. sp. albedinis]|nr:hypothetical protein HZ326_23306 [Fusarium oxysporum f. sp. albedinis]
MFLQVLADIQTLECAWDGFAFVIRFRQVMLIRSSNKDKAPEEPGFSAILHFPVSRVTPVEPELIDGATGFKCRR